MLEKINQIIELGIEKQLLQQKVENERLDGPVIRLNGKDLINFGSCSYLGMEFHPQLQEGVHQATRDFGTQFSSSRSYVSLGLYGELENLLEEIFQKPVIVTASTTLGHLATLPVIIQEGDAVIMDFLVHSSVKMTVDLLKAQGIPTHYIPHNSIDHLETKIKSLRGKHDRIWYLADGVYSMHGDYAPVKELESLLNTYKQFHLYIDDAHGMNWTGQKGVGYVRSQIDHHPKMVMATSLNKSVAASGGAIVFPNEAMKRDVMNCGRTLIFSGPIQPPMLGAAIASAKVMLSEELPQRQARLNERIAYTNRRLRELGLPQLCENSSPLFFIPSGLPRVTSTIIHRLIAQGFYVNSAGFPAVPMKKGGIRFAVTHHHSLEMIDKLLTTMAREYLLGLEEEGSSTKEVARNFRIGPIQISLPTVKAKPKVDQITRLPRLRTKVYRSIKEISPQVWNEHFSKRGSLRHHNLLELESIFTGNTQPEDNWSFYYYTVRDEKDRIVLISLFTSAMVKDDMLAPADVSRKVMPLREEDPYFLTSWSIVSGTLFTKGESVVVDYDHPDWKAAVRLLVGEMEKVAEQEQASSLLIREFSAGQKEQLRDFMLELGLVEHRLLDNYTVESLIWKDHDEYLASLGQRYRYSLRKECLRLADRFRVETGKPKSPAERRACYELYRNVHRKALEISVFELPFELFEMMHDEEGYDIIRLYLHERPEEPVAVMYSYINDGVYNAMLVGLDYQYAHEVNAYKQILYRTVLRAHELGCESIDLAYTAGLEKKKVGAKPQEVYAYTMAMEHYSFAVLESIA